MPQVSLKHQIVKYYLHTLNAKCEANKHATLGTWPLSFSQDLVRTLNDFMAPLPPDMLTDVSGSNASTTSSSTISSRLTESEVEFELLCQQIDQQVEIAKRAFILQLIQQRYLVARNSIPKSKGFNIEVFPWLPLRHYEAMFRLSLENPCSIVQKIQYWAAQSVPYGFTTCGYFTSTVPRVFNGE